MPATTNQKPADVTPSAAGAGLAFKMVDGVWTWNWDVPNGVILAPRQIIQLRRTFELALKLRRIDSVTLKELNRA